jgi:hypothetical protein
MRLLTVAATCSDACTAALAAWSTATASTTPVARTESDADVDNGIVRPATVSLSALATALKVTLARSAVIASNNVRR